MSEAVIYGAGNIGRGFIAPLFSAAGWRICFVDIVAPVLELLNSKGRYTVECVDADGARTQSEVVDIRAINGSEQAAVAGAIAGCGILVTCVGANVLPRIAGNIAAGLARRRELGGEPLDIILAENLMDAAGVMRGLLQSAVAAEDADYFNNKVGLVEASVGRMVPVQTPEMQRGDILRICTEPYGEMPVDADAFRGPVPDVPGIIPERDFGFYVRRKLFIHNMLHALCAWYGRLLGYEQIAPAASDRRIGPLLQGAAEEITAALALTAYRANIALADPERTPGALDSYAKSVLHRIRNTLLGDTCERVGRDIARKLAPSDRVAGAARLCIEQSLPCRHILGGIAAALLFDPKESAACGFDVSGGDAAAFAREYCGLLLSDADAGELRGMYGRLKAGDVDGYGKIVGAR